MAAPLSGVHVLGIRHHGPGSARTVERALEELRPDRVLIEGPPELDALVPFAGRDDLVPPVAGLVYDPGSPRRAAFYPFASFSPEWVALRWCVAAGVPVGFADLPAAHDLVAPADPDGPDPDGAEPDDADPDDGEPDDVPRTDPIAALAAAAGFADPERWWEDAVEQRGASAVAAFAGITRAMAAVREDRVDDEHTLRREAAMRLAVRRAVAGGAERLVVVCGAYHAPALDPAAFPTKRADESLLSGLPKTKTSTTWAPWTSARLAFASGYGAGVTSPGWYAHLFDDGTGDPVSSWMVRSARALRDADLPASPASAVEAARLATALAALRGRPHAGLDEVQDAALAVLCGGDAAPLRLIERELVVGSALGRVPDDVPLVPLAGDLARQQRTLRLSPSATAAVVELDLRRDTARARSVLLHRLLLLDVPWGVPAAAGRSSTGTFAESWELEWKPELAVALVVAGVHGTTVADAAESVLAERAGGADDLAELSRLVEAALLADLPVGLERVVARLAEQTARQHDELALLRTIEPLARVRRYGTVRGTETGSVEPVLTATVARAAVGLRAGCAAVDDAAAALLRQAIESAERGIRLVGLDDAAWLAALRSVADDDRIHGGIAGRSVRLLLDRGELGADEAAVRMSRRLSAAVASPDGAAWLDGFLAGDAQLLLHDDALRGIVDDWVSAVPEPLFDDLLPLVRRTFSAFATAERRTLGELVRRGATLASDEGLDAARGEPALRRMAALLGLEVIG